MNPQHVMIDFVLTNNIPKTISNWIFFSIHLVGWCRHKYQNIISIPHTVYRTKTNVALILAELNGAKSQFIQQKKSNFLLFIGFFVLCSRFNARQEVESRNEIIWAYLCLLSFHCAQFNSAILLSVIMIPLSTIQLFAFLFCNFLYAILLSVILLSAFLLCNILSAILLCFSIL